MKPKSLCDRLSVDSIREFRAAAKRRDSDAAALVAVDRFHGTAAIYLSGYAVEMLLKAAYFATIGFAETAPITKRDLDGAAGIAKRRQFTRPLRQPLHDLVAWTNLLLDSRMRQGLAYPVAGFEREVQRNALRVDQLWVETLRYRKNIALEHEVVQVRVGAEWFLQHSLDL